MSDFNQTRSFNLGIAVETSVEAALIYDDLAYAQQAVGKGKWFYRSYEQLLRRLPVMSERTARRAIADLEEKNWILKKIAKVDGKPVCHFQIGRFLSAKMTETIDSAKMTETSIYKTTKETTGPSASSSASFGEKNKAGPTYPPSRELAADTLRRCIEMINRKEKITDSRLRTMTARLKEYTAEEITAAAHEFSKSEWHKEHGQMSIDNLLAPSKFGRWYAKRPVAIDAKTNNEMALADVEKNNMTLKRYNEEHGIEDDAA